jgi:hypothetical protein
VTFRVSVKDGKLGPVQIVAQPGAPAPAYLRRIVTRNQKLLRSKSFLLAPGVTSGALVFVLDASIDSRRSDPETVGKPGVEKMGLLGIPLNNGAYFTYYSGHHVNLLLYRQY